ncbi:6850_t:CDS:1, partial [Entrophospora sp. SA101]
FVWSYFQEEDGNDVCKILISIRGKETTCGKRYKHDCSTGNMKQHLQVKHGILESEELQTGLEKYSQPKIDSIFKKVIPHDSSKQKELKRITAVWLITDSLPFNVVNKKGYLKIMKTIDPAFNSPSSKSIKNSLSVAYNKGVLQLKELLLRTCETASITTDLWTSQNNDGYIGVTLHWLSPDFEVYDVVLAVEKWNIHIQANELKNT